MTLLQEGNFKEVFKTDEGNFVQNQENYEQNRKFCVVKVETLERHRRFESHCQSLNC